MISIVRGLFVGALLGTVTATGGAQVIEPPPRSVNGLFGGPRTSDPNRTQQELTLTFDLLGGYDDNLSPEDTAVTVQPLRARQSGYTGTAASSLQYWVGRGSRYLEANGRAQATSYSEFVSGLLIGGDAAIRASTSLGDRNRITGSVEAEYRPTFRIEAFGPAADTDIPVHSDLTAGVSELRAFTAGTSAVFTRDWTRRQRTHLSYTFNQRNYMGDYGVDSRSHGMSVAHNSQVWRTTSLRLAYSRSDDDIDERDGSERPVTSQTAEMGADWTKRLSRSRAIGVSLGAGGTHVRTTSVVDGSGFEYVAPSLHGSTQLDLGRSWSIAMDVRRSVSVLEGLPGQSFVTVDSALHTGGDLWRLFSLAFSGGFTRGTAPAEQAGSFEGVNATLQVGYEVTSWCSLVTSYSFYSHLLRGLTIVPEGFPRRFERNSIRLGVTIPLPLYGAIQGEQRVRTRRR